MSRVDTKRFLYAYLKAQADLVAATTNGSKVQIYGPPGIPSDWSGKALEFLRMSTRIDQHVPTEQATFQFRCYGETLPMAQELYAVLEPYLHMRGACEVTSGGLRSILRFSSVVSVTDNQEPEPLDWFYVEVIAEMHWATATLS